MTAQTDQKLLDFEDTYIEPSDAARKRALGLRPSHFAAEDNPHPDRVRVRVGAGRRTAARRNRTRCTSTVRPRLTTTSATCAAWSPASTAGGSFHLEGDGWAVHAATIEPTLEKVGQDEPVIKVGMRT